MKILIYNLFFVLALLATWSASAHADITTGLVGWWAFDEGTGTTTEDSSGSGLDGTVSTSGQWIAGEIGPDALSFNGTNQNVDVPAGLSIPGNTLTIASAETCSVDGIEVTVYYTNNSGDGFMGDFVQSETRSVIPI